jgi:hypothetical protein
MAAKENQLSPEEKLLKVIQEGDKAEQVAVGPVIAPPVILEPTSEDIAAASPVRASAAAKAPTPAKVEEKPKLQLKKEVKAGVGAAEDKAADDAAAKDAQEKSPGKKAAASKPGFIEAGPAVGRKPAKVPALGISTVNRCLAAVVLIMIGFAAYEIWASIQVSQKAPRDVVDAPPIPLLNPVQQQSDISFQEVLKAFRDKNVIGAKPESEIPPVQGDQPPQPIVTSMEIYVRDNLKVIGLSDDEAIVVDRKPNKMYFLKAGEKVSINDQEVDIVAVTEESVKIKQGDREIEIK